ncbi:MAG: 6-phosphofructokinase [Clostridia bacterium]|nr:6-phosphofructokinase [Clostridia bacterium]
MCAKRIAVLTSGGDAPGMNAAVRAVTRTAIADGYEVLGVVRGYNGLLHDDLIPLDIRSVSDKIQLGGTFLYSARSKEFAAPDGSGFKKAAETCRKHDIVGLVVIGGDGSFMGASALSREGIPTIGITGTIDNDISSSDYTIGYDTAMNTAIDLIDKLRDTTESHDRCSVVEVMGRHCGDIALNVGIATGAIAILVPEVEFDLQKDVIDRIKAAQANRKKHFIVVVAEGVGHADEIAKQIEKETGVETRATILGHVQRGGSPTLRDRLLGSQCGYKAVKLLNEGKTNRVVVSRDNKIVDLDIQEALAMPRTFDNDLYEMAKVLSN